MDLKNLVGLGTDKDITDLKVGLKSFRGAEHAKTKIKIIFYCFKYSPGKLLMGGFIALQFKGSAASLV